MTLVHVALIVAVTSTGLFTGLLMTIVAFSQRGLKDLAAPEFTLVMQRFLGAARAPAPLRALDHVHAGVGGGAAIVARERG